MSQERGKERAKQAYPMSEYHYGKTYTERYPEIVRCAREAYILGFTDALSEPREVTEAMVDAARDAYYAACDDDDLCLQPKPMRAALEAAEKARVEHG